MQTLDYHRRPLRISLTPLIDVVFIMLLFFMLASTFTQWQQLSLSSVAKGKAIMSETLPAQLFVIGALQVRHKGEEYLLDTAAFRELLVSFKTDGAHLLLTAESRANIQDVVLVMDHVVAAGLENVSLTSSFDER